jgi:hypothetical protein
MEGQANIAVRFGAECGTVATAWEDVTLDVASGELKYALAHACAEGDHAQGHLQEALDTRESLRIAEQQDRLAFEQMRQELTRIRTELKALNAEADREDNEWHVERKRMADKLEQLEVNGLTEKRSQKLVELDIAVLEEKLGFLTSNRSKRPSDMSWREYAATLQSQNLKYSSDVKHWESRNKALQLQIDECIAENRRFLLLVKSSMGMQQLDSLPPELRSDFQENENFPAS